MATTGPQDTKMYASIVLDSSKGIVVAESPIEDK